MYMCRTGVGFGDMDAEYQGKSVTQTHTNIVRHKNIDHILNLLCRIGIASNLDNSVYTPPPAVFCLSGH